MHFNTAWIIVTRFYNGLPCFSSCIFVRASMRAAGSVFVMLSSSTSASALRRSRRLLFPVADSSPAAGLVVSVQAASAITRSPRSLAAFNATMNTQLTWRQNCKTSCYRHNCIAYTIAEQGFYYTLCMREMQYTSFEWSRMNSNHTCEHLHGRVMIRIKLTTTMSNINKWL